MEIKLIEKENKIDIIFPEEVDALRVLTLLHNTNKAIVKVLKEQYKRENPDQELSDENLNKFLKETKIKDVMVSEKDEG